MQRKMGGRAFSQMLGKDLIYIYLMQGVFGMGWHALGIMAAGLNVWEAYCSEENACIGVYLALFLWARLFSSQFIFFYYYFRF